MPGRIFISYSKADPQPTRELADFLTARGYSVWWDTNLTAGEVFREVIDRELDAADAVIVIWTPHSVGSNWVIAEADHGARRKRLITLRTANLQPWRIPKPYNTYHTDILDNSNAVLAAVHRLVGEPPKAEATPVAEHSDMSVLGVQANILSAESSSYPEKLRPVMLAIVWLIICVPLGIGLGSIFGAYASPVVFNHWNLPALNLGMILIIAIALLILASRRHSVSWAEEFIYWIGVTTSMAVYVYIIAKHVNGLSDSDAALFAGGSFFGSGLIVYVVWKPIHRLLSGKSVRPFNR